MTSILLRPAFRNLSSERFQCAIYPIRPRQITQILQYFRSIVINPHLKIPTSSCSNGLLPDAVNFERTASDASAIYLQYNVLVAEDNPINQKLLTNMLLRIGFKKTQFVTCENGLTASNRYSDRLAQFKENMDPKTTFSIILLDISMPIVDGYECARLIRSQQIPSLPPPYIIAVTANSMDEDKHKAQAAGMDDFCLKPITLTCLKQTFTNATKYFQKFSK
jgi:CheY-like chemotaxis protein